MLSPVSASEVSRFVTVERENTEDDRVHMIVVQISELEVSGRIFAGVVSRTFGVRTTLCIVPLHPSRRCPVFMPFRSRLSAAGKAVEAAINATPRNLLCVVNAMLATGAD